MQNSKISVANLFNLNSNLKARNTIYFEDKTLEKEFQKEKDNKFKKFFLFLTILMISIYIISAILLQLYNGPEIAIYTLYSFAAFDLTISIILIVKFNKILYDIFKYVRFVMAIFPLEFAILYANFVAAKNGSALEYWNFGHLIILSYYLTILDYNFTFVIIVKIVTTATLAAIQSKFVDYVILKTVIFIGIYGFLHYFKYVISVSSRQNFYYKHTTTQIIEYINSVFNASDFMYVVFDSNKILYSNQQFFEFSDRLIFRDNNVNKNLQCSFELEQVKNLFENIVFDTESNINNKYINNLKDLFDDNKINKFMINDKFVNLGIFKFEVIKNDVRKFNVEFQKYKKGKNQTLVSLIFKDITQIMHYENLRAEDKYKQKILSKISHELKTPLNCIIGISQEITKKLAYQVKPLINENQDLNDSSNVSLISNPDSTTKLDNDYEFDLQNIENLANFTILQINDIVQYVSGKKNNAKPNICNSNVKINIFQHETINSKINLIPTVKFAFKMLETLLYIENKISNIKAILKFDESINEITSNENILKRILMNVVSNAVKFTYSGEIIISVKKMKLENMIKITVSDTGICNNIDNINKYLEDTNLMMSAEVNYNKKGSCFGLKIIKQLIHKLGHKLSISLNKKGIGLKFSICINNNEAELLKMTETLLKKQSCTPKERVWSPYYAIKTETLGNSFSINSSPFNLDASTDTLIKASPVYKRDECYLNLLQATSPINDNKNRRISKFNKFVTMSSMLSPKKRKLSSNVVSSKSDLINKSPNDSLMTETNFNAQKNKILIIEDYEAIRKSMKEVINRTLIELDILKSFDIVEGNDGVDMLKLVIDDQINHNIKCILTDENMNYVNGSDAIKIIKDLVKFGKVKEIPIYSVTSFTDELSQKNILMSGAKEIIRKPCSINDIKRIFKELKLK